VISLAKHSIVVIALLGCGGAGKSNSTTTGEPNPIVTSQLSQEPEITLADVHIDLNLARSLARQQALEQARATGVKKESENEPLPEPPPGPRTKESIGGAFGQARIKAIERCYEAALYADQSAQGSVVITFLIVDDGTANAPKATGFTDAIHACLVGEVLKTRFPTGGVTPVRWSLKFTSS
jgi:hypothetical protein